MGQLCTTSPAVSHPVIPPSDISFDFTSHRINGASRTEIEGFISRSYIDNFDAKLASFLPILVSGQRLGGQVNLAFGLSPAASSPLFLENYLDEPVESVLSQQIDRHVNRSAVVELGNLAFDGPHDMRRDFIAIARHCIDLGFRYVVCTATRILRLLILVSGVKPIYLGDASLAAAPRNGTQWGSYYRFSPQIIAGDLHTSLFQLENGGIEHVES